MAELCIIPHQQTMAGVAIDSLPDKLVRAFREDAHRESFLDGHVRMSHIAVFRSSGDASEDQTEGQSHIRVQGLVPVVTIDTETRGIIAIDHKDDHFNRRSEYLNPTYILSASRQSVDKAQLALAFGEFLVELFEPAEFLARLRRAAEAGCIEGRDLDFLDAVDVLYSKGNVQTEPESVDESLRLSYGQKPASHAWESEYRAVLSFSGPLHSFPSMLRLDLGSLRDIVRPLSVGVV